MRLCVRLGASDGRELVLGMANPLLELPPVGIHFTPLDTLELGSCRLQLLTRARRIDLTGLDGIVYERECAILLDLEKARPRCEVQDLLVTTHMDVRCPGFQRRDERRVAGEHTDFSGGPGHNQHLDLPLVRRALRRDEREIECVPLVGQATRPVSPQGLLLDPSRSRLRC
jgi:hypothetical protein